MPNYETTCQSKTLVAGYLFWWRNFTLFRTFLSQNQIFHHTRYNTPKRVTSLGGPSPRHCAWQRSFFRTNVAAVTSCWQRYIWFDRPEIWTRDERVTARPTGRFGIFFALIIRHNSIEVLIWHTSATSEHRMSKFFSWFLFLSTCSVMYWVRQIDLIHL